MRGSKPGRSFLDKGGFNCPCPHHLVQQRQHECHWDIMSLKGQMNFRQIARDKRRYRNDDQDEFRHFANNGPVKENLSYANDTNNSLM